MLQLYTQKILILGLTPKDIETLERGEPLHMEIHPPRAQVTVLFGASKPAILNHLEMLGFEIPRDFRAQAEQDPE
jgi:hypothetical protein